MPMERKTRKRERAKLSQGTGEEAKVANKTILATRMLAVYFSLEIQQGL